MQKSMYCTIEYSPRHILWIVRENDWDSLEEIIKTCSCNYGGIQQPIISLMNNDKISPADLIFIKDYDPDYIIIPDDFNIEILNKEIHLNVFDIILMSKRFTLLGNNLNCGGSSFHYYVQTSRTDCKGKVTILSTDDSNYPDESRFSLLMFGTVDPISPQVLEMDGEIDFDATGSETKIIREKLKQGVSKVEAGAYESPTGEIIPAPDRKKLNNIIKSEYKFPFQNLEKQLHIISDLHTRFMYKGYLQNTYIYSEYARDEIEKLKTIPCVTLFLSEKLDFNTAISFWNARVMGHYSYWFPFSIIENNLESFCNWIDSDYGGRYCAFGTNRDSVISFIANDEKKLEKIVLAIKKKRKKERPSIAIRQFKLMHIKKPFLKRQTNLIHEEDNYLEFNSNPNFSENSFGTYTVKVKNNNYRLLSLFKAQRHVVNKIKKPLDINLNYAMNWKVKIDNDGFVVLEQNQPKTIKIYYPDDKFLLSTLFNTYNYKIYETTAGKYQREVLDIVGDIYAFAHYFLTNTYMNLIKTLVDTKNTNKVGWKIKHPYPMRVMKYDDISNLIKNNKTKKSELLISELIEKDILEYGFVLHCKYCDYKGYYHLKDVGKTYNCCRCSKQNYIIDNEQLQYKLNPIIEVGIGQNNIDVPLGAIVNLLLHNPKNFRWYTDSNIVRNGKERNIDIIFFVKGFLYIGEAKSNDEIKDEQINFYREISHEEFIKGLIFATSKESWKKGTLDKITSLKKSDLDIIILTAKDIYIKTE